MLARKPRKVVAVALANKNARIIWALLRRGGCVPESGGRRGVSATTAVRMASADAAQV